MPTEMSMMETGSTTRPKDKELIHTLMVLTTRDSGLMTNSMDTELKAGLMVHATRVITKMARRKAMEN
jgi:hypothetical protein